MLKDLTYIHGCVLVIAFAGQVRVANMHNLLEINAMQHRILQVGAQVYIWTAQSLLSPSEFCMYARSHAAYRKQKKTCVSSMITYV